MTDQLFTPQQRQKLVDQLQRGLENGLDHGPDQWAAFWAEEGVAILEQGLAILLEKLASEDLPGWRGKP